MAVLSETISFDNLAERVFKILKSRGYNLKMYQENGEPAFDPSTEARKFFVEDEGMMVSINQSGEESELKVYISDSSDLGDLKTILNSLRQTASLFGILYNLRKYDKQLQPKEFAFLAYKAQQEDKMDEGKIAEAKGDTKLGGSTKSSYQKFGKPARIVVRHNKAVDETKHGARTRNIEKIFIENADGERLKFPVNWLQGARTMGRHISEGGGWNDDIGNHIKNESVKFTKLREFVKRNGKGLNEEASETLTMVKEHARGIVKEMKRLQGPQSYRKFAENYDLIEPTEEILDEEIETFNNMFTVTEDDDVNTMAGILKKKKGEWRDRTSIIDSARAIVDAGDVTFQPVVKHNLPKFDDKEASIAFKISDAAARVNDNAISVFLSNVVDSIEQKKPISKEEVELVKRIMPMANKRIPMESAKSSINDLTDWIKNTQVFNESGRKSVDHEIEEGIENWEVRHKGHSNDDIKNYSDKWVGQKVQMLDGGPILTVVHAQDVMGEALKLSNNEWVKPWEIKIVGKTNENDYFNEATVKRAKQLAGIKEADFRPDTDPYRNEPSDDEYDRAYTEAVHIAASLIVDRMKDSEGDALEMADADFMQDLRGDVWGAMRAGVDTDLNDEDYDAAFYDGLARSQYEYDNGYYKRNQIDDEQLTNDLIATPGMKQDMQDNPEAVIDKYK